MPETWKSLNARRGRNLDKAKAMLPSIATQQAELGYTLYAKEDQHQNLRLYRQRDDDLPEATVIITWVREPQVEGTWLWVSTEELADAELVPIPQPEHPQERSTMKKDWTLYLSRQKLSAARAALLASGDTDACEEGLSRLRNAQPGYLHNLLPDDHPDSIRARQIVADALVTISD